MSGVRQTAAQKDSAHREDALQLSTCGEADRRIEREIMAKIDEFRKTALADYQKYIAAIPRRMNKQQAQHKAYLHGFLIGVSIAYREFERRQPIEWQEDQT